VINVSNNERNGVVELLNRYKQDSNKLSMTDLMLGTLLVKNADEYLLITKNILDFPTNIFNLETCFHLVQRRAIQSYGVYGYRQK
jgi:hypothetical protein